MMKKALALYPSLLTACAAVAWLTVASAVASNTVIGPGSDLIVVGGPMYAVSSQSEQTSGGPDRDVLEKGRLLFATFAHGPDELHWALVLVESIRMFSGRFRSAPVWVYLPEERPEMEAAIRGKQPSLDIVVKRSATPVAARQLWYSGKVFAAGDAEAEVAGRFDILVWLDPDVVIVQQPQQFLLRDGVSLAYRPVMHKLIGSEYSEPPDEFWSRLYKMLSVADSSVFPMMTPVDEVTIRPYFNAGLLAVRPERGILRHWAKSFPRLYSDSVFVDMCDRDKLKAIFLHQAALAGAILSLVPRDEMVELPADYNYPLNLDDRYPPEKRPRSLNDVVILRHDLLFSNPERAEKISDTSAIVTWVRERRPTQGE